MRISEALFNGSWPKLSTHDLEKCFEKSGFHLLFGLPKSSFGRGKDDKQDDAQDDSMPMCQSNSHE